MLKQVYSDFLINRNKALSRRVSLRRSHKIGTKTDFVWHIYILGQRHLLLYYY